MSASSVIVDASLALALLLDDSQGKVVKDLWSGWVQRDVEVAAPELWWYELTSTIHKLYLLKQISETSAKAALEAFLSLDVRQISADAELCRSAFEWATRLNQVAAYDGFYLAAAEKVGAELWTLDRRLVNSARQQGAAWVHLAGE